MRYSEEIMNAATDDIVEKLHILLQGESVIARIDQNVVYRSLARRSGKHL